MASDPGIRDQAVPARCVPCLRLFADTLFVDDGSRHGDEVRTAMLRLEFEYAGAGAAPGMRVRAGEPWRALRAGPRRRGPGVPGARGPRRDRARPPRRLRGDARDPGRLRGRGRRRRPRAVRVRRVRRAAAARRWAGGSRSTPEFPWQVVGADAPLYAAALPDGERPDWFALELGVEVDGHRVDLLPALLDLLDGTGDLSSLARPARRCVAVRVDDKRWLPVPPARLRLLAKVLRRAVPRRRQDPRAGDPRAADRRAVRDAARRRRARCAGSATPRIREQAYALALGPRRGPRPSRRRRGCARSCGRTSARASRGCSTCARTAPAACSPTTWGSARRCRRSRTSCSRRSTAASIARR